VLWELSAVKQRYTVIQASLGAMAATVVADRDGSAASRFPAWLRRCQASGLARLEGRASASVSGLHLGSQADVPGFLAP
jgi:hypothetical protein